MNKYFTSILLSLVLSFGSLGTYANVEEQMIWEHISLIKNLSPDEDNLSEFVYLLEKFNAKLSEVNVSVISSINIDELRKQIRGLHKICKKSPPDWDKIHMAHESFVNSYGGEEPGFWENIYNSIYGFFSNSYVVNTGRVFGYFLLWYLVKDDVYDMVVENYGIVVDIYGKVIVPDDTSFEKVIKLDFNSKRIKDISEISKLVHLKELNLSHNNINDLKGLSSLVHLETLNLSHNEFYDVEELSALHSLKKLDLSHNGVYSIKPLVELKRLKILNLNSNKLNEVHDLAQMTSLTHLYMKNSIVINIFSLRNLTNLVELDLYNNNIEYIYGLPYFKKLKKINLGSNSIGGIPHLKGVGHIIELNLSNMYYLRNITHLKEFTGLEKLNLSFLDIEDVSPLKELQELKELDLTQNENLSKDQIAELEKFFIARGQKVLIKTKN